MKIIILHQLLEALIIEHKLTLKDLDKIKPEIKWFLHNGFLKTWLDDLNLNIYNRTDRIYFHLCEKLQDCKRYNSETSLFFKNMTETLLFQQVQDYDSFIKQTLEIIIDDPEYFGFYLVETKTEKWLAYKKE